MSTYNLTLALEMKERERAREREAYADMLAALKEAYRDMLPLTESDDPETHAMAERIRAAIAKAEGTS